ncbi:hypothetical protein Lalb_Chr23g0273401 [Lupinus albus]|uniref:Uncharacterized protein n=1 Tax=Lupinus albus TaxID=3870 RepID=A0A6A4NL88_LUPAL|nr:hypothetical protein Lalb_Chr23g0273401 [Lupinus albus]
MIFPTMNIKLKEKKPPKLEVFQDATTLEDHTFVKGLEKNDEEVFLVDGNCQ